MKTYLLKWRGTSHVRSITAETLTKAKIDFANREHVNPLLVAERIAVIRKPSSQDILIADNNNR